MLIKQIDHVGVEAIQGRFSHHPDPFRLAVQTLGWHTVFEAKLGCDDYLVANRSQRLADNFLVRKRTICFGSIEEGHAAIISGANYLNCLTLFGGRAKAETQAHAAETESRHFQPALSQFSLLHVPSFLCSVMAHS